MPKSGAEKSGMMAEVLAETMVALTDNVYNGNQMILMRWDALEQVAASAQLLASLAAAVALPFDLAMRQNLTDIFMPKIPFSLAVGSLALSLLTSLFRLYITQVKRYNLSPCLGEHIGISFDAELQSLYKEYQTPLNTVEPKDIQTRRTWEFVAREFLHRWRFDTALQADRFGSILQFIQSGPTSLQKVADNEV